METILIPTDFKPAGLSCLPVLCEQLKGNRLNLLFVHMFKLSDSISELLLLSKRSREYEYISDEFRHNCRQLKQQYPAINSVKIEFFYGSTLSMFKNFLEAHAVTFVLDPADCSVSKLNKTSVDPGSLVERCNIPVISLQTPKNAGPVVTEFTSEPENAVLSEV